MREKPRDPWSSPEIFGTPDFYVTDPVHGGVGFFEHEGKVIDHLLFQRIRYIRQCDVLSLVFPAATHTRFIHSVGTMHVAGELFKYVLRSHLIERTPEELGSMKKVHREAILYFNLCLRLAALLHDTGHAPFSHQFENSKSVKMILTKGAFGTFKKLWNGTRWQKFYGNIEELKALQHEHYSVRCAYEILLDQGRRLPVFLEDVIGIMEGTDCRPTRKFCKFAKELFFFLSPKSKEISNSSDISFGMSFQKLFKSIVTGPLDVDKMDYLLRDSHFTGCMHGVYNLPHLLRNIRVARPPSSVEKNTTELVLAIHSNGLESLEEFVYSRFQLYTQVYSHKTYCGFKYILREAMDEIFSKPSERRALEVCLSNIQHYSQFTDEYFWARFRTMAQLEPESWCARLIRGDRLDYKDTDRVRSGEAVTICINKRKGDSDHRLVAWSDHPRFSEITPAYEKIMVRVVDKESGRISVDTIGEKSRFFDVSRDVYIVHFFADPIVPPLLSTKIPRSAPRSRSPRKGKKI